MSLSGRYIAKFRDQSRVFEVGERTALVSMRAELSRLDNDLGPLDREVSPGRVDDLECDVLKVSVFDDESGVLVGEYSGPDIPEAERSYWEKHAETWLRRRIEKDPDFFSWSLENNLNERKG